MERVSTHTLHRRPWWVKVLIAIGVVVLLLLLWLFAQLA